MVRGEILIRAVVQPSDRTDVVSVGLDERSLPPSRSLQVDTRALPDGEHSLTARVEDRSLWRNWATATARFQSDNTPPRLTLELRPAEVRQGSTTLIRVQSDEPAEIRLESAPSSVLLRQSDSEAWFLVGIDPALPAGARPVRALGQDAAGNEGSAQNVLAVSARKFPEDRLQVAPSLADLLRPEVRAEEERQLRNVYLRRSGPALWQGRFQRPVAGPITTEFGEIRYYNGGPSVGYHAGTDFASQLNAPVTAPARARVALVDEFRVRGRVVVLDHGAGVFTTFAHLTEWLVQPGDEVQQGQPIARVGSTGLSTGPHLHWELWVGGENVDPIEWTERAFP